MRPEAGVLAAVMLATPALIRAAVSELAWERIGEHTLARRALLDNALRRSALPGYCGSVRIVTPERNS
jgi:hypothetical protein